MQLVVILGSFLVLLKTLESAFVDPQYKLVKWTGWGGALGWVAPLYEQENEILKDEIYDAIFSPDRLNLNILRYTIWGTSPGDSACESKCTGCREESFRDASFIPFIWSRDAVSRNVLLRAKTLGVDTFEAVAWSPPSWMTRTKCATGNPDGAPLHDNFDPINSNAFADYLTEVIKHYNEVFNITFSVVSPFYRPSSGRFTQGWQEGCNMERETIASITKSLHQALLVKNLTFCNMSTANEHGIIDAMHTQKTLAEDYGIASLYTTVGVHRNSITEQDRPAELSTMSDKFDHAVWSSETMALHSRLPNMTQGNLLGTRIISEMRQLLPTTWLYFQVIETNHTTSNGLIRVPGQNASVENLELTSGYYALMQFSKYIRKGFTIVHVSDSNSVAAYDEKLHVLVIVTINPTSSALTKSFDLSAFTALGQVSAFRTSPYEPHVVVLPPIVNNNQINFEFPAESVTTLRIVNAVPYTRTNLVQNGDFEDIYDNNTSNPWSLAFGARPDNEVNDRYSYRGKYSGNLDLNESMLTLMQTVIVNVSRTYHLSAWCSTTGVDNTLFGILVNGMQGPEITIEHDKGYQLYGLSVNATDSDVLSIYLRSERGNHTAQIDIVMLH